METTYEHPNLSLVRRYFDAIERGAPADELAAIFAPDVTQEEFPNRLVPNGATRDLAALLAANARGKQVIASQRYDVQSAVTAGDAVVLEVVWTGTLKVAVGALPAGGQMRCRSAMFIEVKGGRIASQRNYDCFDPF